MSKVSYKPCGAKKRNGEPCKSAAMPNGRCRLHGGLAAVGPANGSWKDGRRSIWLKHLRGDLRKGFLAAKKDSELKGLQEDIHLQKAFISDLLAKLAEVEPPPWGDAVEAFNDYCTAKTEETKAKSLTQLGKIIRSGKGAVAAEKIIRAEVRELVQEHTRTEAAEWKRLIDLKAVMTEQQVGILQIGILRVFEEFIPDRRQRADAIRQVVTLIGMEPRRIEAEGIIDEAT